MENFIPGLTPQDFFEVYKVLVKTELLENKSLVSGSEILERFTQDLMICNFHDTRAHWYYRFKSPRILSKLLMSDEGGCSHRYPGVGNIAYVKDLMTRKMATTTFNCSRFGASIAPGLGWEKMNRCFKESCPIGFAYLPGYHIDTSGSYSYSVMSARSGIQDSQTSFVGCDHGKCCACFGPDSKQDYCAPKCQAINGGTVLREKDNITVWFWIRSSLPKRVWKKCMEFKEKNSAGKMKTWRVEDGIRRKGPCSVPEDVTINDGVAVVPNNQSMNKLPKVEGLLSYLSDKKKLYIKEKSQWTALANQKEIKDVIGKLDSFKQEIDNKLTKVNRKSEKKINDVSGKLNNFKQEINNKLTTVTKDVKVLTHKSCKQIWMSQSNKGSGVYQISVGNNQVINVYCQMTSVSSCYGGGWTMVMKIDGRLSTFKYSSSYWTSRSTYGDHGYWRNRGLDNQQYKGSSYWRTSFKEICVGMKYGGRLRAISFSYPASSLYNLIADEKYRQTRVGRAQWKSFISGSSLQSNCNQERFNVERSSKYPIVKVRLGIIANQENDCNTPDSFVGLGAGGGLNYPKSWCGSSHTSANAAGNLAQCNADKGNKNVRAMAYIL
ncbi:Hypothetical predicted protein, partial [Paramuricea clavata]